MNIDQIKTRHEAITMGDGDWHRMKYDDGSLMPDFISAGQSKEGYSLDVIISECEKPENMEFISHCPTDIPDLIAEVERLEAREEDWAKLLKSANNDVERLNEHINRLRGT